MIGLASCSSRALPSQGDDSADTNDTAATTPGDPTGSVPGDPTGSGPNDTGPLDTGPFDGGNVPDFNDCAADPEGTVCAIDADCCSGHCYEVPVLSNLCGECESDLDCPNGGCTAPNPLPGVERGSRCNFGELGGGCDTDAACEPGLACVSVLDVAAFGLDIQTCGECRIDDDCGPGRICNLGSDFADFSGYAECVLPGSLPLNETCTPGPSGDLACASGHCELVDAEGLVQLHVCGECSSPADCPSAGETCLPGELNLGTLVVTGPRCG